MHGYHRLSLAAVLATCATSQFPLQYPHGLAHADCGPADGPAVRIVLSNQPLARDPLAMPNAPFLELLLNAGIDQAVGRAFVLDPAGRGRQLTGFARRCGAPDDCQTASTGRIRVTAGPAATGESTIEGTFELGFGGGERQRGRFAATWVTHRPMCG